MKSLLRRIFGLDRRASPWNSDTLIREELFSVERLEQHASSLALAQTVTANPRAVRSLNARLGENGAVLLVAYRAIAAAATDGETITPAAEWLIDNYHLVDEQIRQIHDDLPPRFYRQLPKLAEGPFSGYPRVLGIAWACVAHSDSRFDPETLRRFVRAYQQVQPLTIGELWAVAITLRIVLVENLRRAAERIVASRVAREAADRLAERLLGTDGIIADPEALIRHHDAVDIFSPAFVVQLVKRLRDQDPRVTPALLWMENQLAMQGTTGDEMVHTEHQRQGASNVTVRNIITSMRLISDVNWPDFFEDVSLVDQEFRSAKNLSCDFETMDFATRNLYRTAIEALARGSARTELDITRAAIDVARAVDDASPRARDPGYHLLAGGRRAFERAIGYRAPMRHGLIRFNAALGPGGYIGAILLIAAGVLSAIVMLLKSYGIADARLVLLALFGLIPAVDTAVALVNRAAARGFGATLLPGLELRDGVPTHLRTLVVVPTLLTTPEEIAAQIERLEVHFLAASHGETYFALLSDWRDASTKTTSDDQALLKIAADGIASLNAAHGKASAGQRFYLLHRRRVWSDGQRQWMGWERKRGKLHELNRLLRGSVDTTFIDTSGQTPCVPINVRYVVTLDADTRLPRETVRRLVGKLAHPLNQPRFDATTGRVVEGYAVLQPRVTPSLPIGREGSLFQRVFSSMNGIDPYDAATSDVYQDLFGEGSYAGKGIYDIDAFEVALENRIPDGSLLSHDLFEGTFARSALASDIEVVEEFPARYDVAAVRNHRWARGDWQLLPWMLGRGGSLPLIGFWKMLDNLRRTLSAPSCIAAFVTGLLLPLDAALAWTGFITATIVVPPLLPVLAAIVPRRRGISARSHLRALGSDLQLAVLQCVLLVTFLAHQAWLMVDAIVRTLYRLTISRRNLLEWVTAAQAQLSSRLDLAATYRRMSGSVVVAIGAGFIIAWRGLDAWALAMPFLLLWIAAPAIARWISISPLIAGHLPLPDDAALALRLVARRTWRYFETFVTAKDHMLPPDNFQEDPRSVVAHRTSPTNIGLYLLCAVSARDFGWIGTVEAVERLEATLVTLKRLQRFRGHFYNWYDTTDLRALDPQYVSSVDSGNLAAHLIAVANACREWIGAPNANEHFIAGVKDAMQLARAALRVLPDDRRTQITTQRQLEDGLNAIANTLSGKATTLGATPHTDLAALVTLATNFADGARAMAGEHGDTHQDLLFWSDALRTSIECWQREVARTDTEQRVLNRRLAAIEAEARTFALAMEFDFLLDLDRKLLAIGYRAVDGTLDPSCYDLLASEARLASFFAIAKNDAPTRHWFRLGRAVTSIGNGAALISWSGSMFEYLMPSLVMRAPAGSLLEQTSRLIVRRQIEYGDSLDIPWGVSESAYSARDIELTYQYSNFGVPGLGLKRGLSENVVIAPYATGLAAMVDPQAAARNFEKLAAVGALGRYGFYEALDYTRSRLPDGAQVAIVKAFMAHHQGMTIVAIANVLFDGRMRARFHAESNVQATELLLQERTPRDVSIAHPRAEEVNTAARISDADMPEVRRLHSPHSAAPQVHLLSNGRYAVMVTGAGSGYSRWRDLAITRWRDDTTRDDAGSYIFLRDVERGVVWTAGFQPSGVEPDHYEVTFAEDRAEFVRSDGATITSLQVVVSPEDDAEVRRVSIANTADRVVDVDVTSYLELVLATPAADAAHQAFSKLFVQTEYVAKMRALLATRRRRSPEEPEIWVAHHVIVEGESLRDPEFETDRARFLGRGRDGHEPIAVMDGRPLTNSVGTVLDPIFSLRHRVRVQPRSSATLSFWTCVAASRAGVLDLVDKQQDANAFARASTLAWTQAQVQLRHRGMVQEEANLFQRLAGHVLYADASMRPSSDSIKRGGGPRAALWAQSISGDLPIVLLRIDHLEDIAIARQLLQAHEYWRLKQLAVDIVILNERASSYIQDLQIALETLVRISQSSPPQAGGDGAKGSVFVLRADLISAETRAVLSSVARVVLIAQRGSIVEQLERRTPRAGAPANTLSARSNSEVSSPVLSNDLEFFNGLGGFTANGREYLICLDAGQSTPAPWINVVANPKFGFQCAAEGGGYTWSINSRENQLTQWSNDPVIDRPSEVLYVRDEETGALWGPTVAPMRDAEGKYYVRHGQGFSRFEHSAYDTALDLTQFVPLNDSIKICRLKIRNASQRNRRLSITAYLEWVLGTVRGASAPFIVTEMDTETGAMFARNPWNTAFASRVAFADLCGRQTQWTGDRKEFLGRHGRLDRPAALLTDLSLAKRVGAGLDPCCALQATFDLGPGESTEIVFFLGEASSTEEAQSLIKRYRSADLDAVFARVIAYWDDVLGMIEVKTPDRSMDILLNRWLLYQALACRTWARSAFYQASGAYGFRDQLQDGMALAIAQPDITREHLLRAAGRQFPEGDVQHWWLPPTGIGVRTRISDDRIWLAYAAAHYLNVTGDFAVFDEEVAFIEGAKLAPGDHDLFYEPATSEASATFFEHCARGLDNSLELGAHGLPLIGTGDWNDGMNRVGEHGRGESVWLGWFLHAALSAFAGIAEHRNEHKRRTRWLKHAVALRESLEREAWDGAWYRRGYFDDGTPFGSAASDECRIDSIAQSWSVISGAGDPNRATQAMTSVDEHLIKRDEKLALLFAPPFDQTPLDPGYVKGYPPGIRENGGQYTHAAAWSIIAFAQLGQGDKAAGLFSLINPINRTGTRTDLRRYKVEPYVVAADVYSVAPHTGRGGWTWYTGSAAWLYRAGLESILGFRKEGNYLSLLPCIPKAWSSFEIIYKHRSSRYEIVVDNLNGGGDGAIQTTVDDVPLPHGKVRFVLLDDGATHRVRITLQ
jgi:cyclic beta-1,2-glucan synthetase